MVQRLLNTGQFKVSGDTLYYKRVWWLPLAIMEDDLPVVIYLDLRTLPGLKKMLRITDLKNVTVLPFSLSDPDHNMTHEELVKELLECYMFPEVYQLVEDNGLSVLKSLCHVFFSNSVDIYDIITGLTKKWDRRNKWSVDKKEHERSVFVLEKLKGLGLRLKILEYYYVKNKDKFFDYKYVW